MEFVLAGPQTARRQHIASRQILAAARSSGPPRERSAPDLGQAAMSSPKTSCGWWHRHLAALSGSGKRRRRHPVRATGLAACRRLGKRRAAIHACCRAAVHHRQAEAAPRRAVVRARVGWHGSQLAVDGALVSPRKRAGEPHPRADVEPGHSATATARRKRHGTYPELLRQCRLVGATEESASTSLRRGMSPSLLWVAWRGRESRLAPCGDHLAACPRSGVLRARGGPATRMCDACPRIDSRRNARSSPDSCQAFPPAGAALATAKRVKERPYPELCRSSRCRLTVGGRWSAQAASRKKTIGIKRTTSMRLSSTTGTSMFMSAAACVGGERQGQA